MKKIFLHYKFKCLITLARLGLTLPLHYTIINNLGILLAVASVLYPMIFIDSFGDSLPICAFLFVVGIIMGGTYSGVLFDIFTINEK